MPFKSNVFSETSQRPVNINYTDSYEVSFLVNRCVRVIAEKVATTKFILYKLRGKKVVELEEHPVLDLLNKANSYMTGHELLKGTQSCLEIYGNAYWLKLRGSGNKILELWPLRPDWVEIKQNESGEITGYKYCQGVEKETFDPDDIIHFKNYNPKSSLYGMSSIKPAMELIENLVYATRWNKNFFYRSARPDILIFVKSKLTDSSRKEFEEKWKEKFGGIGSSHTPGLFEGEDVKVDNLNPSIRDMDFANLTESMIQQILLSFGVPKSIIGMQGMNRAEAEAQMYAFLSETIEPKVKELTDRINEFLISEYGDDLFYDYEDPTPENRQAKLLEYDNGLKNNWLLINEVRDMEGLPPIKGGWNFYLPLSSVPAGGLAKAGSIDPKDYYKHKEEIKQKLLRKKVLTGKKVYKIKERLKKDLMKSLLYTNKKGKSKKMTKEQKDAWWRTHDALLTKHEKEFGAMSKVLLEDQRERVLKALKEQFGKKADLKFDWKSEQALFARISLGVIKDIVEERGERAAKLVGSTFVVNDNVLKFIDDKRFKFAKEVNETTREHIKEALKEGVSEGEGINELTKRLNEVFDSRTSWENERIARTEVIGASNGAENQAYLQSDVVEKLEWLTTIDGREREWHGAMNGETIKKGEKFSNGLEYPGDPSGFPDEIINCRCTQLPIVD